MKKTYRKIATIQAEQFDGSQEMMKKYKILDIGPMSSPMVKRPIYHFCTLEGSLEVNIGDWIATGIKGEHWAIKDDIFRETYAEAKTKWNKFKTRPITEEEREERPWVDEEYRFDQPTPELGQKVLVTDGQWVGVDEWDDFAGVVGLLDFNCYDTGYDNLWWAPIPDLPKTEEK
ncbi:hypothetical protein [Ligilactobacillus equi]|uniref:DUF551 domain-containing protein n=1 Tax=Ligilactobacillus equi DSM 15833 = JCM 10991 TaxID=1423740 RepID=A0A0R1TKH2_9LACO|nr:hypothetical protein [Ligilactobacillus equi]KRL81789.1 hypothetical protein FC36_GL001381 [Ligilactobacillus equi DSM 15833 = JCM 10991]